METVIGIELLCAAQGLEFREPLRPGRGVERAYDLLRERVPALDADRGLAPDIDAAAALVREGTLTELWRGRGNPGSEACQDGVDVLYSV